MFRLYEVGDCFLFGGFVLFLVELYAYFLGRCVVLGMEWLVNLNEGIFYLWVKVWRVVVFSGGLGYNFFKKREMEGVNG